MYWFNISCSDNVKWVLMIYYVSAAMYNDQYTLALGEI